MAKYALPVSKQTKAWKKGHKSGPAFPINNKRQAASARGFAVMMVNKGQLSVGEARQIVKATAGAGLDPAKLVKKDGKYRTVKTNPRKRKSMATKRKRKSTKRTVRRAKGTRRGQARKTARRAFVGTKQAKAARRRRSRARRNPSMLRSPAVRFSIAAVAGAAAAAALDENASQGGMASRLQIPLGGMTLSAGVTGFLVTLGVSRVFKLKAKTRATATAAAFGMLAPTAIRAAGNFASGLVPTPVQVEGTASEFRRLPSARMPRTPVYNSAAVFVDDLIPA